jgi:hypothetical protein
MSSVPAAELRVSCLPCGFPSSVHVHVHVQLSAAAAYFGLTDQKDTILGGYLMGAFFIVGAPAAILVSQHKSELLCAADSLQHAVEGSRRPVTTWVVLVHGVRGQATAAMAAAANNCLSAAGFSSLHCISCNLMADLALLPASPAHTACMVHAACKMRYGAWMRPQHCCWCCCYFTVVSLLQCGYLADKHNRVLLLAAIIIIGEAPCLCTYWVSVPCTAMARVQSLLLAFGLAGSSCLAAIINIGEASCLCTYWVSVQVLLFAVLVVEIGSISCVATRAPHFTTMCTYRVSLACTAATRVQVLLSVMLPVRLWFRSTVLPVLRGVLRFTCLLFGYRQTYNAQNVEV